MIPTSLLIMAVAMAAAVWYSPSGCRWLSWLLESRAAALDSYWKTWKSMRDPECPMVVNR